MLSRGDDMEERWYGGGWNGGDMIWSEGDMEGRWYGEGMIWRRDGMEGI